MATVILPRSLVALFPGTERRHSVDAATVAGILDDLERDIPGLRDRLVEAGPVLRRHINVYVDGEPASLTSAVGPTSVVHVIPAVSGGARKRAGQFESAGGAGGRGDSLAIEPDALPRLDSTISRRGRHHGTTNRRRCQA